MNNYLRTGHKGGSDGAVAQTSNGEDDSGGGDGGGSDNKCADSVDHDMDCDMKLSADQRPKQSETTEESSALTEMKMITSNQPKIAIDMDNVLKVIENAENGKKSTETGSASSSGQMHHTAGDEPAGSDLSHSRTKEAHKRGAVTGPDPTKPLQPKAKLLRQQRKAEKLLAKANASPAIASAAAPAVEVPAMAQKKAPKNMEKALKSFIEETPTDGKHQLKVCMKQLRELFPHSVILTHSSYFR